MRSGRTSVAARDWERERREPERGAALVVAEQAEPALNRLMLRAKGYTKSLEMLTYPLALVCWRQERKSNAPSY